jgi:hypothetical protein
MSISMADTNLVGDSDNSLRTVSSGYFVLVWEDLSCLSEGFLQVLL